MRRWREGREGDARRDSCQIGGYLHILGLLATVNGGYPRTLCCPLSVDIGRNDKVTNMRLGADR